MLNPLRAYFNAHLETSQHTGIRLEARQPGSGTVLATHTFEIPELTPEADGRESLPMAPLYNAGLPDGTYFLAVVPVNDGAEGPALVSEDTFEFQRVPPAPTGPITFA